MKLFESREQKTGGHDPHHLVLVAIQQQRPAHQRRIAAEASHPHIVAKDRYVIAARPVLFGAEGPSVFGYHTQQREKVGGNSRAEDPLRLARPRHVEPGRTDRRNLSEFPATTAELQEIRRAHWQAGEAVAHLRDE